MGVAALGNVDILVRSKPEVDPYFSIMMPDPPVGWRRARFLRRNENNSKIFSETSFYKIASPLYLIIFYRVFGTKIILLILEISRFYNLVHLF
jgi:hypothetical protein